MKYVILVLIIMHGGLIIQSQPINYDEIKYATKYDESKISSAEYEKWYIDDSKNYFIVFKQNTVGIKKLLELTSDICRVNNFDFLKPNIDKSYLASFVNSLSDYENLNLSISVGGSIIDKKWERNLLKDSTTKINTSALDIILDEKKYMIRIYEYAKSSSEQSINYNKKEELSKVELYNHAFEEFKSNNYKKSDSLFSIYKTKYPNEVYGYYWCFRAKSVLDSNMKEGLAINDCKSFIELAELTPLKNKSTLITAYNYISAYTASNLNDFKTALVYLNRILEIDPQNLDAKRNIQILEKAISRQR